SHDSVGACHRPGLITHKVAGSAGRNINGNYRSVSRIDLCNRLCVHPQDGRLKTTAKDRINQYVATEHLSESPLAPRVENRQDPTLVLSAAASRESGRFCSRAKFAA